jgi:phage-related protein
MPSARLVLEFGEKGYSETKGKVSDLNQHVEKTSGFFKNAFSSALGFVGASIVMNGVSTAANFLRNQVSGVVNAFGEADQVGAQTNAVLNSTEGISGMTAEAVGNLADSLSRMSGIDDEVIQSGENMLLTFTNIGKDIFPQTTQAALDMSVALKEDMGSAAMQLGKALNDPVEGVSALQRVGVKLTETQRKQVESFMKVNDIASAQKIILNEINREFGKSAENYGNTLPGAISNLNTSFGNLQEKIGGAVAPTLIQLSHIASSLIDSLGNWLPGALSNVSGWFSRIVPFVKEVFSYFQMLWPEIQNVGAIFEKALQPTLTTVSAMFQKLGSFLYEYDFSGIFEGIDTAATLLGTAINTLAMFVLNNVIPAFIQFGSWAQSNVLPILAVLATVVVNDVLPALSKIGKSIIGDLVPALQNLWEKVSPVLIPALKLIGWVISTIVGPALVSLIRFISQVITWIANFIGWISHIGDGFSALGTTVHNIITGISSTISAGFAFIQGIIQGAIDTIVSAFKWLYSHNVYFQQLVDEIIAEFNRAKLFVERIVTVIRVTIQDTWNGIVNGAKSAWKSFTDQISNALGAVGTAMSAIGEAITKPITDLGSKLEAIGKKLMQKLIDGIKGMAGSVKDAAGNILSGIGGALGFHGLADGGTAPGGTIALAERGMELVTSPGLYNVPKGSHVYNNSETIDILSNSGSGSKGNTINVYPAQSSLTEDGLAEIQRRVAVLYG